MDGWTSLPDKLHYCTNLSANAKCVAWTLIAMKNKFTGKCYPTVRQLAKRWNIGKTAVTKALKELEQAQIIAIKRSSRIRANPMHRPNHVYKIQPSQSWTLTFESKPTDENDTF